MTTKSLREVTDYMWSHQPTYRRWPQDIFTKWVEWHWNQGFISLVLDFDESIAGLAIVVPVMNPEDAKEPYNFDMEGRCLCIREVISTAKGALVALGFAVLKQYGMRELVCWQRPPFFVMETHKASVLRRNLFRVAKSGEVSSSELPPSQALPSVEFFPDSAETDLVRQQSEKLPKTLPMVVPVSDQMPVLTYQSCSQSEINTPTPESATQFLQPFTKSQGGYYHRNT